MDTIYFVFQNSLLFTVPLVVVALGGMFSERSGIVNIALEGIMVIGAFFSIFFIKTFQGTIPPQLLFILAMFIAMFVGILFSLLHAYASINMKANQTISGTALNLFAPAFAVYTARMVQGVSQIDFKNNFRIPKVPLLGDIPVIGNLIFQNVYITTYIGIGILVVASIILYKTRFGLRLRACGEHPQAADSAGINVIKMRYIGVMMSGALAGLGGLIFVVPISTNFSGSVLGYGFLALAVLIFGQWKPSRILFAAFFFGMMKTIASTSTIIPFLADLSLDPAIYKITPYLATLIVLAFSSKNSAAPRAAGEPYDAGKR
ncbi:MAG: sugar ABC transporter permease [Firmicutes bacterium GWF2_51_9]|nr:MAG: sugar ABC transporter permease [Firmicutes bacterium GWF2_51_9]OGS59140.1 MAG: sugar ABC transporter permease [Firmicutes bacterium GWE2_51_13]HAO61591.1 sugar ABC transporter permease [Erysipelotrichaceae bacterium]